GPPEWMAPPNTQRRRAGFVPSGALPIGIVIPFRAEWRRHAGEQDAYRRDPRRRCARAPLARRAVSAMGKSSHRAGPLGRNGPRTLPARRGHGGAAAAHRLGRRAGGEGAALAAATGPAPAPRHPGPACAGEAGRGLSLAVVRLPLARWRERDPRAPALSGP